MKTESRTVAHLLEGLSAPGARTATPHTPLATGFSPLDRSLRGGLRPQELVVLGGKPGVGKTIAALQWARNMALEGHTAIFACYEHSNELLLSRLLLLEVGALARAQDFTDLDALRSAVVDYSWGYVTADDVPDERGIFADALACMHAYSDRLWLTPASAVHTGVPELTRMVEQFGNGSNVLVVDYLQKVAVRPEPESEVEKVTRVADGLKELAMTRECAIVAVAASSREGLMAGRQRIHHLRGSTALAYESDLVLMLNDKVDAVSKIHLAYDPVRADDFRNWVILDVEKNRSGEAHLSMEFRKDFANARFDPDGRFTQERLIDERIVVE